MELYGLQDGLRVFLRLESWLLQPAYAVDTAITEGKPPLKFKSCESSSHSCDRINGIGPLPQFNSIFNNHKTLIQSGWVHDY